MLIGGAQLENPAAPLSDLLRFGLQTKPGEVALLSAVRSLTWSELEEASSRVAAGYLGLGLEPGDRVASLMPNRVDLVVHYLACFKGGLIATPLNYRYTATEIDHALGVSGGRARLGSRLRHPARRRAAAPRRQLRRPGGPRGDLLHLRLCRAGSDKVSTELLTEFAAAAGFPIVESYGMTEVGLATLNPPSGEIRQGSIGTPIGGFRIELRGEDGEPIEAETVGRIWIETRSRMSGYWDAPEATAEVVVDGWLDSGDVARRLRRLPLVLRPQEAGHRPRRLQHQPLRGRGRRVALPVRPSASL